MAWGILLFPFLIYKRKNKNKTEQEKELIHDIFELLSKCQYPTILDFSLYGIKNIWFYNCYWRLLGFLMLHETKTQLLSENGSDIWAEAWIKWGHKTSEFEVEL